MSLSYDPDCEAENSWYYDNPADPVQLQLCSDTCDTFKAQSDAALAVEFTCGQTITVIAE